MSALRQPQFPAEYYSGSQLPQPRKSAINRPNKFRRPNSSSRPTQLHQSLKLPIKLQILLLLQKGSFGLALISMATSLGVYISSVRIPQLWSQEYQNLENLQRQERQLTAINETLKYQIAQQAREQKQNLTWQKPEEAVFVTPATVEENSQVNLAVRDDSQKILRDRHLKLKHAFLGY